MTESVTTLSPCSCCGYACKCCSKCVCKTKQSTTAIDGLKEIGSGLKGLSASIDVFPAHLAVEVQAARDAGYVGVGLGVLIGLMFGMILGVWLASKK